jgi:MFS family permease
MPRLRELIPALPRDAWVVLAADAISAVGTGLTLPFLLVYLHATCGIPLAVAGLAVSTLAGGSVAGNVAGGALSDRAGPRNALVVGLAIAAAGTTMLVIVAAPWQAFAATASIGLGAGIVWPAQDALLAAVVEPGRRSSVFSVRMASMNAGLGTGALVAAAIVHHLPGDGFDVLYLLDALSFLSAVPIVFTVTPPRGATNGAGTEPAAAAPDAPGPARGYRDVITDRRFLHVWLLTALVVALSYGQLNAAFPAYATGAGGVPAGALGLAYAANTLTVVAGQLLVLRTMRGRRRTTSIVAACTGWGAAWTLTFVAGHLGAGSAATGAFVLALIVFGIAETFLAPALAPIVNDLAPAGLAGRYNGLYTLAWTTGFLLGPTIAATSLSAGQATALFAGLICACGAAAVGAGRLRHRLPAAANVIAA